MLNFCDIVVAILKMETGRNFSMSGINSGCWNRTMLNLCCIVAAILKMATCRNFSMSESIRDIIIYPHMKWRWNQTMLNLCGIVTAILKMATGRNFSMSGYHYLPKYQILMIIISDNVEFWRYCDGRLKMATGRKFSLSGINSGHHYLPPYQILMILDNVEFFFVFENFETAELLLRWWPIIVSKCMSLLLTI